VILAIISTREVSNIDSDELIRFKSGIHDFFIDLRLTLLETAVNSVIALMKHWEVLITNTFEVNFDIDYWPNPFQDHLKSFIRSIKESIICAAEFVHELNEAKLDGKLSSSQIASIFGKGLFVNILTM